MVDRWFSLDASFSAKVEFLDRAKRPSKATGAPPRPAWDYDGRNRSARSDQPVLHELVSRPGRSTGPRRHRVGDYRGAPRIRLDDRDCGDRGGAGARVTAASRRAGCCNRCRARRLATVDAARLGPAGRLLVLAATATRVGLATELGDARPRFRRQHRRQGEQKREQPRQGSTLPRSALGLPPLAVRDRLLVTSCRPTTIPKPWQVGPSPGCQWPNAQPSQARRPRSCWGRCRSPRARAHR